MAEHEDQQKSSGAARPERLDTTAARLGYTPEQEAAAIEDLTWSRNTAVADAVVLVTHTVMDGTVVRWYYTVQHAENHQALLSASRNGVMIHGSVYWHNIPQHWLAAAEVAYGRLARGYQEGVGHFATHRHQGALNGPLVPVGQPPGEVTNQYRTKDDISPLEPQRRDGP